MLTDLQEHPDCFEPNIIRIGTFVKKPCCVMSDAEWYNSLRGRRQKVVRQFTDTVNGTSTNHNLQQNAMEMHLQYTQSYMHANVMETCAKLMLWSNATRYHYCFCRYDVYMVC